MIEFKTVALRRDGRVLFEDASFQIHPAQKVGLTGNNGTGKSSLFALLLGNLSTDTGEVVMPAGWQIAHMAQEVDASEQIAIDYVTSGDEEWYQLNEQLQAQDELATEQIAKLHQRFDDIDGYRTPTKAAQIMAGLGFTQAQQSQPVCRFSGGWRMRLNLAKTLMSRADLLLLDEPTNHLDLDAIIWLEEWLAGFAGTVLLISHDQTFLDACVDHILHIEQHRIQLYTGNYSQFVRIRSERLAQQQQAFAKQQATRAHLEDYIRRFRAKASKAKQAQSRIKQLERMTQLSPMMADNPFSFSFYPPDQMGTPLIAINQGSVGYDGTALLHSINMQVTPDTRLGLLGMNGAGKSTLIKALVGELSLLAGKYQTSDNLKLGYFNQHQMDSLDAYATPMLMLRRLAGTTSDAELRRFLGGFDFRGERIDTPSGQFSGGERARLTLALIVWQRPNLLVLDEPTNHLDLQMRQALTLALQGFTGAVVLVSHDRELIANVCDELYLVHDGKVAEFAGDIGDYGKWLKEVRKQAQMDSVGTENVSRETSLQCVTVSDVDGADNVVLNNAVLNKEDKRKRAARMRQHTAPLRKQISQLEKQLDHVSAQLAEIEQRLVDTSLYDDERKQELLTLLESQTQLNQQLEQLEEDMLISMTQLEEAEATFT